MKTTGLKNGDRLEVRPQFRSDDWVPATYVERMGPTKWGPAIPGNHWVILDKPVLLSGTKTTMVSKIIVPAVRMRRPR